MSCHHLSQLSLFPEARSSQYVHKEECTQCFDTQDLSQGVDVCLSCFNGGCINDDSSRKHAQLHSKKLGHTFSLNVKRKVKPSGKRDDSEPPLKKLAIIEEREEDMYDYETVLRCWSCDRSHGRLLPEASTHPDVKRLTTAILQSMSSARQSDVKAWEEEIIGCEHTLTLQQVPASPVPPLGLAHCLKCDLKENLWLCLSCGALGCGRQQFGGLGGNGHGLDHFKETNHPVSVKLGTITPEGDADIFCYQCNDSKLDPELAVHLSSFGINISMQTKTEKSVSELQVEQNLKFDFSLTSEDGKALDPVFGPGLTGLGNLGNSCYIASTLQAVFSLPAFRTYYLDSFSDHAQTCTELLPANCLDCQMRKLADGLLSGRYSSPRSYNPSSSVVSPTITDSLQHPSPAPVFQQGIKPSMFKTLIGKGHPEFATMRQQDAEEFFTHLLKVLRQQARKVGIGRGPEPIDIFRFGVEQRLQCLSCGGVRYRNDEQNDFSVSVPARVQSHTEEGKAKFASVQLTECLDMATGVEEIEYNCPRCAKKVVASKRTLFATFPDVLVLHAKKFQLLNWVPTKLDIPLEISSDDTLELDKYLTKSLQPGEQVLPDDDGEKGGRNQPEFDQAALNQLQVMGFPLIRCQKALLATGNNDPEAAMEWLFAHAEDPDIDTPLLTAGATGPEPSIEQIDLLSDMGFTAAQARKALKATDGNPERAVEWLFSHPEDSGESDAPLTPVAKRDLSGKASLPARYRLKAFISHKGPSVHSGHYVVHIRMEDDTDKLGHWVLFNDEKVVKADVESVTELKRLAYLYIFQQL